MVRNNGSSKTTWSVHGSRHVAPEQYKELRESFEATSYAIQLEERNLGPLIKTV